MNKKNDNPFAWNDAIQEMQQMEICEIMPNVTEYINAQWHNAFEENPAEKGEYLCTCASTWQDCIFKFIRVMQYDKEHERWADCGHINGCSNKVIGWADIPMYKKEFTVKQVRGF